jgi:hypothetical protein
MEDVSSQSRRLRSLGIRDHPISRRSPWQNGCAERLIGSIGSIGRESLDHVVVFGERDLRHVLSCHINCYNAARCPWTRTHRSNVPFINRTQARPVSRRFASPLRSDLIYERDRFTTIDDHISYIMVRIDHDKLTPLMDDEASKKWLATPRNPSGQCNE